jgi:thioesterase domain-containing protein
LFCVHPAEGLAWCYLGLTQSLPESSLIGLQATGLSGVSSADFPSMIAEYIQQIYAQQAEGAYRLLGWSSGGGIAHALATALQATGLSGGVFSHDGCLPCRYLAG